MALSEDKERYLVVAGAGSCIATFDNSSISQQTMDSFIVLSPSAETIHTSWPNMQDF